VQPNPDPKPDRWILHVVILAMMGFAWLFINAAEDPTLSSTSTTSATAGSTTTTTSSGSGTTTTTVLPADAAQYNLDITAAGIEMAGIQEEVIQTNSDWEAGAIGFAVAVAEFTSLDADVKAWRTGLDTITVPTSLPQYADFHAVMITAADEVVRTSAQILPGLQAPDSGELRRAAITAFNDAVTAYGTQVNTIVAYRPDSG
jgi:hypothetical protein